MRRRSLASSPTVSPEGLTVPSSCSVASSNVVAFRAGSQQPKQVVGFDTTPKAGSAVASPFSTLCSAPEVPAGGLSSALRPGSQQVASVQRSQQGLLAKALSLTELQRVLPQASGMSDAAPVHRAALLRCLCAGAHL